MGATNFEVFDMLIKNSEIMFLVYIRDTHQLVPVCFLNTTFVSK